MWSGSLVVTLAFQLRFVLLASLRGGQVERIQEHVGCPTDLLHHQQFAAGHDAGCPNRACTAASGQAVLLP
jgi:hypothetical protein